MPIGRSDSQRRHNARENSLVGVDRAVRLDDERICHDPGLRRAPKPCTYMHHPQYSKRGQIFANTATFQRRWLPMMLEAEVETFLGIFCCGVFIYLLA